MSRKITILLAAVAVVLLLASTVLGAALGPHQDAAATNPCRDCHNTASGTPALRGWAGGTTPLASGWASKPISYLCYMCHGAGGGPLDTAGHGMINFAYHVSAHQYRTSTNLPPKPDGTAEDISGTGLPYVTGTQLECTSCHNVHVSTNRPFNQRGNDSLVSFQALCDTCHPGRVNNDSATSYPSPGTHAYETHPTRQGFGDTGAANIKAAGAIEAELRVTIAAAPNYSLGGHLNSDSTFDCQTCHAVHGVLSDGAAGVGELLARDRGPTNDSADLTVCESCHFGGDAGEQVGTLAAGGLIIRSDHPIDADNGQTAFYPTGAALPAPWVSPGVAANNNDAGAAGFYTVAVNGDTPICASCHDTHGGMLGTDLLRGPVAGGWAFGYDTWCFVCHTNAQVIPDNHHSVVQNWATSELQCGNCHGTAANGTDWKAHNGFWAFPVAVVSDDSAFCEACHTDVDPRDIADGTGKGGDFTGYTFPASHGSIDATGGDGSSHVVDLALRGIGNVDFPLGAWPVSGGTSEWGDGAPLPANAALCESCHNILTNGDSSNQGLTNGWEANLLLLPYEADVAGEGSGEGANDFYGSYGYGAGATGDSFCRVCHNNNSGSGDATFVHNPGAHTTVDYDYSTDPDGELPYGRTTVTILTTEGAYPASCPEATTADMSGSPGAFSYPDVDAIDCDSCHRPHSADPDSISTGEGAVTLRYLILKTTAADGSHGTTPCAECHNTDIQCNQ